MGARPSSFRTGGGFLNDVDGIISNYQWTDEFDGQPWAPGKIKFDGKTMDRPHSLNMLLSVRVDGASEDTTTTIRGASNFDEFDVDETGRILTSADGGPCALSGKSGVGKFIASLCDASDHFFPEDRFDDNPNQIDLSPMVGTRVRFTQRKDEERTKMFGKRKDKQGVPKYDRTDLVIDRVYALPEVASAKAAKGAKTVTKAAGGKPNGKAVTTTVDVPTLAGEALIEMLTKAGRPLAKQKLSMLTLTTPILKGNPAREDVRTYLFNDDNLDELAEAGLVTYDRVDGIITLAEA